MKPCLRDTQFITDNKTNTLLGVCLGWDFASEHESGIKGLRSKFGVISEIVSTQGFLKRPLTIKLYGLDRIKINTLPEEFCMFDVVHQNQKYSIITTKLGNRKDLFNKSGTLKSSELGRLQLPLYLLDRKAMLACSWDCEDFAICVKFENKKYLTILYNAFLKNDIVIYKGMPNNPFSNTGLMIMIKSKIEPLYGKKFRETDLERENLENEVKKSKIIEKLKRAKKEYYELTPDYNENGQLKFFLNPKDTDKYNQGWYSLEDLLLWVNDKGPIVKNR